MVSQPKPRVPQDLPSPQMAERSQARERAALPAGACAGLAHPPLPAAFRVHPCRLPLPTDLFGIRGRVHPPLWPAPGSLAGNATIAALPPVSPGRLRSGAQVDAIIWRKEADEEK